VGVLKATVDCNKDTQTTITRESNVSPKYFYVFFHPPKKMASLSRANHPKYHMGLVRKNLLRSRQQIENDVPCKLVLFCIWEDCRNELEIAHGPWQQVLKYLQMGRITLAVLQKFHAHGWKYMDIWISISLIGYGNSRFRAHWLLDGWVIQSSKSSAGLW